MLTQLHLLVYFLFIISQVQGDDEKGSLKPITMPALGRTFTLGALYDRRREKVLGPKIWSSPELARFDQTNNYGTFFDVVSNADIKADMAHFGLSASMKMSFLAGQIDVSGSAGYLQDRKTHNRQARVSLGYKSDTYKRTLHPELFTKVTYPEVLKQEPDATDVVAAIQYGAGATFTFDRIVSEEEKVRDIQGKMHISVTKLPAFSINGTGYINMTEKERKEVEKFSCNFHGDFNLKTHPGTYEEAIKVYKELPSLLGEHYEHSVPVKVWLYPVEKLPVERTKQLVYEIDDSVCSSVTDVVTELEALVRETNDMMSSTVCRRHERIRRKVSDFQQYVKRYTLQFKQKMATLLPLVKKEPGKMSELVKLVSEKEASPFNRRSLEGWLSYFREEVETLARIQGLPNYCRNAGDFSSKLLNKVRYTLGLTLQLGTMKSPYLDTLKHYLDGKKDLQPPDVLATEKWFTPGSDMLSDLYVLSATIRDFDARQREEGGEMLYSKSELQFLVREQKMEEGDKPGIRVEFYEKAMLKDRNYDLTSSPGIPKVVKKTYDTVGLKWGKPVRGADKVINYNVNVYVRRQHGQTKDCSKHFCKVRTISTKNTNAEIKDLKSQTAYFFTVSTTTTLGEMSVSPTTDAVVTDKCSPGMYHVTTTKCSDCQPGTYSDKIGMTSCEVCPAGTYNTQTKSSSSNQCVKCPAGTYNVHEGSTTASSCTPCPIGSSSSHSGANVPATCKKCDKGTYSDHQGSSQCTPCPISTYNPDEGQSLCQKCPPETHTRTPGSVTSSECIGKDAIAVALRKVDEVQREVKQKDGSVRGGVFSYDKKLSYGITQFHQQSKELQNDFQHKLDALVKEMKIVHECQWKSGEGSYIHQSDYVNIPNVKSRQECVYRCRKLRHHDGKPFNGVSRKLSTKSCTCIVNMVVVSSHRYEHCFFS